MDQNPEGQRALNDIEAARVRVNLRMFFASEVEIAQTPAEAQALKAGAGDSLADALANPVTNNSAAELLLKRHVEDDASIEELYAYYFLIRRTRDKYPESILPNSLLSFVQEQAQDHGEIEIAFDMIMLLSDMDDARVGEQASQAQSPIREIATKAFNDALRQTVLLSVRVDDQLVASRAELDDYTDEQQNTDRERIANRVGTPQLLLQDIIRDRFLTLAGLAAAKAQQDSERLLSLIDNPTVLLQDIIRDRFLTSAGLAAAKAHQDSARLLSLADNPTVLLQDIIRDRFLTSEGLAAAKAQQDSDRLISRQDNPTVLLQDIIRDRFLTSEGLAAAKAQQDSERLAQDQGNIIKLRLDLSRNRFLTVEGIAEAQRLLDLE